MELGVGHLGGALLAGWLAKELCAPQRAEPVSAPCACVCKCDSPESSPFPWAIVIVLVAGLSVCIAWFLIVRAPRHHSPTPKGGKGVLGQSGRTLQLTI